MRAGIRSITAATGLAFLLTCLLDGQAFAGALTLRLGPPSLGNGGTNPVGIPPSVVDVDVTWLTESHFEMNFSVVPGLLFGHRMTHDSGLYLSLGGGLIISANGVGLGPYSGFGWEVGNERVRLNAEVKQTLGVSADGLISPYALRLGLVVDFNG